MFCLSSHEKYTLLTLKTKLRPFVHRIFGSDKEIVFLTREGNLDKYKTAIYQIDQELDLLPHQTEKLQLKVDQLLETPRKFALVFSYDLYQRYQRNTGAISWIQSVAKYVSFDEKHQAYLTDDGIVAKVLFGDLEPFVHHDSKLPEDWVEELSESAQDQIQAMYLLGSLPNPSAGLVEAWELQKNSQGLYQPTWSENSRIVSEITKAYDSVTDFLLALDKGQNIYFRIGTGFAKRHVLTSFLRKVPHSYFGSYLVIPPVPYLVYAMLVDHFDRLLNETTLEVIAHPAHPDKPVPKKAVSYSLDGIEFVSISLGRERYQSVYEAASDPNTGSGYFLKPDEKDLNFGKLKNPMLEEVTSPQLALEYSKGYSLSPLKELQQKEPASKDMLFAAQI